jgi:hypothetical protein
MKFTTPNTVKKTIVSIVVGGGIMTTIFTAIILVFLNTILKEVKNR